MTEPLRVSSLPAAVYAALRASILEDGTPSPGQLVTEAWVSERFAVARPTAKAAIERLVADGLLTRQAHKAARVAALSRMDIEHVYETRALIEEAAVRNLAIGSALPPAAASAHRDLLAFAAAGDRSAVARADVAFHRALVVGQPNQRLARMHDVIMGEVELCTSQMQSSRLIDIDDVVEQHERLVTAILGGAAELAEWLILRHIEGARDRLLAKWDAEHSVIPSIATQPEGMTHGPTPLP